METAFEILADRLGLDLEERETARSLIEALPAPLAGGEVSIETHRLAETLGIEDENSILLGEKLFALMTPKTAHHGATMAVLTQARFDGDALRYQFNDEFVQILRSLCQEQAIAVL